jgi:hypothetical protein
LGLPGNLRQHDCFSRSFDELARYAIGSDNRTIVFLSSSFGKY